MLQKKVEKSQNQSSEVQFSELVDVRISIKNCWNLMEMVSFLAVVQYRKMRFSCKKLVLTTFLGGYVAKKSWKSGLNVKLNVFNFDIRNRQFPGNWTLMWRNITNLRLTSGIRLFSQIPDDNLLDSSKS